jgi:hypothetical protein
MNEQFRVAQKIGLMFRPDTTVPKDIKTWAISQLHADSISYRSRWEAELEQLTRPVAVDEDHDYYTDGKVLIIELIQDLAAEV